jgi:hypothetical protein
MVNQVTIKNDPVNGTGDWATGVNTFAFGYRDIPTFTVDTLTGISLGIYKSFNAAPAVSRVNAGTFTGGALQGYTTGMNVGAGCTIASVTHIQLTDVINSGTVNVQTGLIIPLFANATANIGLQNFGTTVYPPQTKVITVVGDTIPNTSTNVRLNNTSGASKTLTSAPTIADGTDGQEVLITNTSAQDVVIQDQGTLANSNLRLAAATRTLSQRDNIRLKFDGTVNDWIETAFTNVI